MYILKTTTGDTIRIDSDELVLINNAKADDLILFRQGAVLKRMIGLIVEDPDRERDRPREIGAKTAEVKQLDDIFPQLRPNQPKRLS